MADVMQTRGLREMHDQLKALGAAASKGGGPLRAALAKAATLGRNAARELAPVESGVMRDNIVIYRVRDPRAEGHTEQYHVLVRWRSAKKVDTKTYRNSRRNRKLRRAGQKFQDRRALFYAKLIEFGRSGVPAQPFMRPAFESTKQQATAVFAATLRAGIDRVLRALKK